MPGHRTLPMLTVLLLLPALSAAGPAAAGCASGDIVGSACTGTLRPGSRMSSPAPCELAWVLEDHAGALYQLTAGSCVSRVGESVAVVGLGRVGEVVYRVSQGLGSDIALVRLDPAVHARVEAGMCHWGGPTGIATGPHGSIAGAADLVLHTGDLARVVAEDRGTGVLFSDGWAPRHVSFHSLGQVTSGAPLMLASGAAVGVITHVAVVPQPGTVFATRLHAWLPIMEDALGLDLALVQGGPVTLLPLG